MRQQQLQTAAHIVCAVGDITHPVDDVVQEHHIYRGELGLEGKE